MTAQLLRLNDYPKPVQATSAYLNRPLRTEAEVINLRDKRMAAVPVDLPCDTGDFAE